MKIIRRWSRVINMILKSDLKRMKSGQSDMKPLYIEEDYETFILYGKNCINHIKMPM